uniref:Uncharacterized protein n=1 Tax=Arundo donax TaxID=35708 RepID=A0A0A8YL80_ARUDO
MRTLIWSACRNN